jgi:hypothetical protein
MDELKAQIRYESSRAVQLSQEAKKEFEARNWAQGRALMKEAVAASGNCQRLIDRLKGLSDALNPRS